MVISKKTFLKFVKTLCSAKQSKMIKRCLLIAIKRGRSILKDSQRKFMFKRRGYTAVNYEEIKKEKDQKNPEYKHQIFLLYCDQDEDFVEQSLLKSLRTILNENR